MAAIGAMRRKDTATTGACMHRESQRSPSAFDGLPGLLWYPSKRGRMFLRRFGAFQPQHDLFLSRFNIYTFSSTEAATVHDTPKILPWSGCLKFSSSTTTFPFNNLPRPSILLTIIRW
jgi:hypothetical protein